MLGMARGIGVRESRMHMALMARTRAGRGRAKPRRKIETFTEVDSRSKVVIGARAGAPRGTGFKPMKLNESEKRQRSVALGSLITLRMERQERSTSLARRFPSLLIYIIRRVRRITLKLIRDGGLKLSYTESHIDAIAADSAEPNAGKRTVRRSPMTFYDGQQEARVTMRHRLIESRGIPAPQKVKLRG